MEKTSLFQWIWKDLRKAVLIPVILVVGTVFMGAFYLTREWGVREDMKMEINDIDRSMTQIVSSEAELMDRSLLALSYTASLTSRQFAKAVEATSPQDKRALATDPSAPGVYELPDGRGTPGAAVYDRLYHSTTDQRIVIVQNLLSLEPYMSKMIGGRTAIRQLAFRSCAQIDFAYPYEGGGSGAFDRISSELLRQCASPRQQDAARVQWSQPYREDGEGDWLAAGLYPVISGDRLAGWLRLEVSVSVVASRVSQMEVPWNGLSFLLVGDEELMARPTAEAERLLGSPGLAAKLAAGSAGQLCGSFRTVIDSSVYYVNFRKLEQIDWELVMLTSGDAVHAHQKQANAKVERMGVWLCVFLSLFYIVLIAGLYVRLRLTAGKLATPLVQMKEIAVEIGEGNFIHAKMSHAIMELDATYNQLVSMGERMKEALCQKEMLRIEAETARNDLVSILQSLEDIVYILDENGIIINIWSNDPNDLAAPAEQMIGQSFRRFVEDEWYEDFMFRLREVIASGRPFHFEYRIHTLNGWKWRLGRLSAVAGSDGRSRTVSVLSKDITDRKDIEASLRQAKEEAEQSSRAKSEFLSSMSHELRTPLHAVLGYAQLLEHAELEPEYREYAEEIHKAGTHLLELISGILDLSRIESGTIELNVEDVPVLDLANECLRLMEPMARDKEIVLIHLTEGVPLDLAVRADRFRLKEIVLNLLSNAVKYNRPRGMVSIHYDLEDEWVRIIVSDTGIGISPDEWDNVFEQFYRIRGEEEGVEGTGIGLPLSKQLAALMDGAIEIWSEPGMGSRFGIRMPRGEGRPTDGGRNGRRQRE